MGKEWSTFYLYFPSGKVDATARLEQLAAYVLTKERIFSDRQLDDFICSREYDKYQKTREKTRWNE